MAISLIAFSTDPGTILDFSGRKPAEIFNEAVLPRVNSFLDLIDEGRRERESQLSQDLEVEQAFRQEDEDFFDQFRQRRQQAEGQDYSGLGVEEEDLDYDSPIPQQTPSIPVATNLTDFVKKFEGFSPKAFEDYKQTSIGYGTRAKKNETTISKEEADRRLADELADARKHVEKINQKYNYDFSPNELDALTSFAYNVGNIEELTNKGRRDRNMIASKMLEYNKAGGKPLKGLTRRRQAERNLFTKGY